MQGKSRVMAAVAASALTVALGAGAARCAIAPQEGAQDSPQEQEQPAAAGADAATGKAASGAEALWNTVWTGADDPTATLRIVEGAMVESSGGTERAWFFSAEEPTEADGVLSVPSTSREPATRREACPSSRSQAAGTPAPWPATS